ncbi:helix-turn-helix transcriptional regulator [Meiothermus sp. CFH 77666]|nr:helix-turn-helix transcriptional regulator [Meiothermus sp. CFH 77666]
MTPTERKILVLVAQGSTNVRIAQTLGLSPNTVSSHRSRVMRKLGLRTPGELRQFAQGYLRTQGIEHA